MMVVPGLPEDPQDITLDAAIDLYIAEGFPEPKARLYAKMYKGLIAVPRGIIV